MKFCSIPSSGSRARRERRGEGSLSFTFPPFEMTPLTLLWCSKRTPHLTLMNGAPVPGVSSNQVEGSSARVKAGTKNEPPRRRVTPASPFPPTSHSLPPLLLPFLLWLRFQLCGLFTFLACAGGEKKRKGKGGGDRGVAALCMQVDMATRCQ